MAELADSQPGASLRVGLGPGMAADYRTLSSDLGNREQARDGSFAPSEDEPAARFTEDDTAT